MNGLAHILEDFAPVRTTAFGPVQGEPLPATEAEVESLRLEAFEAGYKAGWEDAIKAQSDDQSRISSALGQHLQDLSFTYHEARSHVTKAMTPLIEEMVNKLLPEIARASLGGHISDQLSALARQIGALEVVVAVSPSNVAAVAPALDSDFGFPVTLVEDETLADEQADIRFGDIEKQIDLSGLLQSVQDTVRSFSEAAGVPSAQVQRSLRFRSRSPSRSAARALWCENCCNWPKALSLRSTSGWRIRWNCMSESD